MGVQGYHDRYMEEERKTETWYSALMKDRHVECHTPRREKEKKSVLNKNLVL